ncbi:hypothetical protein HOY82DRAFT_569147 [Tuber indicum]|nr:hypothetical protein HOY82DRAFT_569147 [Tuber indicum]
MVSKQGAKDLSGQVVRASEKDGECGGLDYMIFFSPFFSQGIFCSGDLSDCLKVSGFLTCSLPIPLLSSLLYLCNIVVRYVHLHVFLLCFFEAGVFTCMTLYNALPAILKQAL